MKKLLQLRKMLLLCALIVGSVSAWADEVTTTYVFTSKSWTCNDASDNWTSGKDGNQFTQDQGIQITTGATGANGTSPTSFTNVSKIVVRYCTNASKGAGTIKVQVGSGTEQSFSVTKPSSGGTTLKDAEFTFDDLETGFVKVTCECSANSVYIYSVAITTTSLSSTPTVSADPTSLTDFTYVAGNGPSEAQTFSVSGENLTGDMTLSLGDNSNYEMCLSGNGTYTNILTIIPTDGNVAEDIDIRLKSGLSKGNYNGTLTISSTDATSVEVSLSGSVTGQLYNVNVAGNVTGGTIEANPMTAEEGTTISLSAQPAAAYTFGSWSVTKQGDPQTTVTVENNQFTMPAYDVDVTATFTPKPTYAVTCASNGNGTITSQQESAYEGQVVTLEITPATGYVLAGVAISKTSDGTATDIDVTNDKFEMPAYAVTATATFREKYSSGVFTPYSSDITTGHYVITYGDYALKNAIGVNANNNSTNRFDNGTFTLTDGKISNPSEDIVWYIEANGDYWTIYNDKEAKYAAGTGTKNQGALINGVTDLAKWTVTRSNSTFEFGNYGRSQASSDSGNKWLRNNGSNGWACYASGTGGALTLYKLTPQTQRTITFNGNGGTYNNETTYTQQVNDGVATALTANQFTNSTPNTAFAGWSTAANGDVEYADGASVTLTADLTLYAIWSQSYTATVSNAISNGTVKIVTASGDEDEVVTAEGAEVTLSATPATGYRFSAWDVYKTGESATKVTVTGNKFTMPAYDVTISATFELIPTVTYTLAHAVVPGRHYIITSGTTGTVKAMGAQGTNNRGYVEVSVDETEGTITVEEGAGVTELLIEVDDLDETDKALYFTMNDEAYDESNNGYLYAASSGNNWLRSKNTYDADGEWTITIGTENDNDEAVIQAPLSSNHHVMRYNASNKLFSCYLSSDKESAIYLFERDDDTGTQDFTASINAACTDGTKYYGTFSAPFAFTVPSDVTVSEIGVVDGELVVEDYLAGATIPANTGVMISSATAGDKTFTSAKGGASVLDTENNLRPTYWGITAEVMDKESTKFYRLTMHNGTKIGFWWGAEEGAAFALGANKAYLAVPEAAAARIQNFWFDGEAAGIESSQFTVQDSQSVYNLNGQRVSSPKSGLYIVNGKKVIK